MSSNRTAVIPSLPQQDSVELQQQRAFQLSMARTEYNYMRSYLESVPMSADLPSQEKFTLDYEAQVLKVFAPLAENFKQAVTLLLERELSDDMPTDALRAVEEAFEKLSDEFSLLRPGRDMKDLHAFLEAVAALPKAIEGMTRLPRDLEKMFSGLDAVFKDLMANGPTAFLKSTLYDMLSTDHGRNYLRPRSVQDYQDQFISLPKPLMLSIEPQPWMPSNAGLPCEHDWFFGHLQIAGFNTTQLRGVVLERGKQRDAAVLSELQTKCPITDAMLQSVSGDAGITLAQACREHRLFVVDYAQLVGVKTNSLHDEQRYIAAPIAVFYWNPSPPPGFPPAGAMQPIAIQLGQSHDAESTPIFTPNDCAGADDANGYKWKIAKYIVNAVCAIQHESVAHLGDCHLIIEPMVVAMHRQLAETHPLYKLLIPHFRFTININDDAIHSLVVPGGVVACNVGIDIESSLGMVSSAHRAWRWDERTPERQFALRAVDQMAEFPFRDDTLLLWKAIKQYVNNYVRLYYRNDQDVAEDSELQGWIYELTAPEYCGFQGLDGLQPSGDPKRPWKLDSLDYLIEMISLIIYTAGPLHASVNYAQFPLMSYVPGVSGSVYREPPTRATRIESEQDCLSWYTPLDVSLYGASFEFLLSAVQYDTFGRYEHNPRDPYFNDPRVEPIVADLQAELARIETEIRRRNQSRPMPYPFQLPSQIPNSISI